MDHDDPDTTPRIRLAAALAAVTPHSPTLCEGWQARHLAAHVMLRERAPHRVVADLLRRAPVTGGHLGAVADDAAELPGYTRLVEEITQGPWRFSPMATRAATLTEFLVHEQDVRRGEALPSSPTRLGPRVSASVWRSCLAMARMRLLRHRDGHGLGAGHTRGSSCRGAPRRHLGGADR